MTKIDGTSVFITCLERSACLFMQTIFPSDDILNRFHSCDAEHVLRKIHHCTFQARKWAWKLARQKVVLTLKSSNDLLDKIFTNFIELQFFIYFFISATGQTIITAQTAFHHCTFRARMWVSWLPKIRFNPEILWWLFAKIFMNLI